MTDRTNPSNTTREFEGEDAQTQGHADRMPTRDEEKLADEQTLDETTAEHYEEMAERGAHQQGEGKID